VLVIFVSLLIDCVLFFVFVICFYLLLFFVGDFVAIYNVVCYYLIVMCLCCIIMLFMYAVDYGLLVICLYCWLFC